MTHYLNIVPLQEPADLQALDDDGRAQCVFNVLVTKRPGNEYVEELLAILTAAGVGTVGAAGNMTGTADSVIERGDGPFLSISATPGAPPIGTHNEGSATYRRPGAQIIVRARTWTAAYAMACAAYDALVAVRNQAVSA